MKLSEIISTGSFRAIGDHFKNLSKEQKAEIKSEISKAVVRIISRVEIS